MTPNTNNKNKNKAHALAAWEWFKEAAWLQVLLIVGVVVGLVIAIPFAVSGIVTAIENNDSNFYESNNISYAQLEKYLNNEDNSCDGLVGDDEVTYTQSTTKTGFVVMFYKDNCSNCSDMQEHIEDWYKDFSSSYGDRNIKFYAINVGWVPGDEDDCTAYEGRPEKYENEYITLAQQMQVQENIKYVYDDQDDDHQNSSVSFELLSKDLETGTSQATMPTPCFVTYTKDKNNGKYVANQPEKVIFGAIGSLSINTKSDVAKEMNDIYGFQRYAKEL